MGNLEPVNFMKIWKEHEEWLSGPYPTSGMVAWNKKNNTIEIHKIMGGPYEINLDRCTTKAEVLNWIFHIMGKNWAKDIIYDLLYMFRNILPSELLFD